MNGTFAGVQVEGLSNCHLVGSDEVTPLSGLAHALSGSRSRNNWCDVLSGD